MAATCRLVATATSYSDKTQHQLALTDNVAAGETLVLLTACSVTDINGIVGYADADAGPYVDYMSSATDPCPCGVMRIDEELGASGGGGYNGMSCLSQYVNAPIASGTTIRFGVKHGSGGTFDASGFYHGQSPWAAAFALNSGDGRFYIPDVGDSVATGATTSPASPSITTADDAIVLGSFGGTATAGAGWFTAGTGWTELVDTAQGTESAFNFACQYRIATSSFSGTSSGTSSVSANFGALIMSYKAVSVEPTKTGVIMLGNRSVPSTLTSDFFSAGNTAAWPFTANYSGAVQAICGRFSEDNPTINTCKVGIYDHDAANNRPLRLLGSAAIGVNPVNWVPFKGILATDVYVAKGTTYWLAFSGANEQGNIQGLSSAASGREGTGNMVATWVAGGNMGVIPGIWAEGTPVPSKNPPPRMPLGV